MAPKTDDKKEAGGSPIMLLLLFIVWYAFNAGYNVYNAKIKTIATPWAISCAQRSERTIFCLTLRSPYSSVSWFACRPW